MAQYLFRRAALVAAACLLPIPFIGGAAHADGVIRNSDPYVQAQIDEQLRLFPNGIQVSTNEIAYGDDVVMVFAETDGTYPTDPIARASAVQTAFIAARTKYTYGCPYGSRTRWYCFYEHINFGGRMLQFKDCSNDGLVQYFGNYGFRDKTSSWVNTSDHLVYVFDDLSGDIDELLWWEDERSLSAWVGNDSNDRADYFETVC